MAEVLQLGTGTEQGEIHHPAVAQIQVCEAGEVAAHGVEGHFHPPHMKALQAAGQPGQVQLGTLLPLLKRRRCGGCEGGGGIGKGIEGEGVE